MKQAKQTKPYLLFRAYFFEITNRSNDSDTTYVSIPHIFMQSKKRCPRLCFLYAFNKSNTSIIVTYYYRTYLRYIEIFVKLMDVEFVEVFNFSSYVECCVCKHIFTLIEKIRNYFRFLFHLFKIGGSAHKTSKVQDNNVIATGKRYLILFYSYQRSCAFKRCCRQCTIPFLNPFQFYIINTSLRLNSLWLYFNSLSLSLCF